ncbi:hypothetical protein K7472_04510 [Streptomyces sp. PTM05]|uniref:Protein-L-isoaspartate O-methyltransferase n=1 Tax=Streptantibioticus parmotrematis TaxID=2873249 RepID=A0ABS7QLN9_9ACTN|nr:methyltransferase domain-containing protein [Streptantibioticus parmotrematis]MBY8884107.1 hypothetical protein [Streptantibioticus parmotrematis]
MTTAVDAELARTLRGELAANLEAAGHDPAWVKAVREVPRHLFVPEFHTQDANYRWSRIGPNDDAYLSTVYSDRALTTQRDGDEPTSSSSEPSLMLTMLEALDIRPGHRVYECGTGTGWNAALLAHRFGDAGVTTVDVDPELTRAAVAHLTLAGYHPLVHTGDGVAGLPEHGPYDRFITTCRMRAIPWAWVEQCADEAVMVAPIGWGLVRITVENDRVHGRFLPDGACFMPRREDAAGPLFDVLDKVSPTTTSVSVTGLLDRLAFPLSLALPSHNTCTWYDDAGTDTAVGIWTPDGSTAKAGIDGSVRQTGPRRLWDVVEKLDTLFPTAPCRADFGLTITRDRQRVWWRAEDGPGWELPTLS